MRRRLSAYAVTLIGRQNWHNGARRRLKLRPNLRSPSSLVPSFPSAYASPESKNRRRSEHLPDFDQRCVTPDDVPRIQLRHAPDDGRFWFTYGGIVDDSERSREAAATRCSETFRSTRHGRRSDHRSLLPELPSGVSDGRVVCPRLARPAASRERSLRRTRDLSTASCGSPDPAASRCPRPSCPRASRGRTACTRPASCR